MNKLQKQLVQDGWGNVLTGLNIRGRDKKMHLDATWERLSWLDVEHIYAVDNIAKKIVNFVVEEAFRKPIKFKIDGDKSTQFDTDWNNYLKSIDFFTAFKKGAQWGRLYGGGLLLLGIKDGQDPSEPINYEAISSVDWKTVLHRWEANVMSVGNDVGLPYYKEPELFSLSASSLGTLFHASRAIRFDGEILPDQIYRNNSYWHDSVLTSCLGAIKNFNSAHDGIATLLQDFNVGVFKMKNLAQLIASGRDADVIKRLSLVDIKRSLVKSIVVDESEDFERKSTPLNGLGEAVLQVTNRLVVDSKIPHTILLGEGATGTLSGAGDSEQEQWDDYVSGVQNGDYKPKLMQAMKILLSDKSNPVTKGQIPAGFDIEFLPLEQMSEADEADIYAKTAEADSKYIQNQVLTPDEVAISRFGGSKFNSHISIDVNDRGTNATE